MVYIATNKSKQIIKDAHKREKKGEDVDWNKVFEEVDLASAKGSDAQVKAIGEIKKK